MVGSRRAWRAGGMRRIRCLAAPAGAGQGPPAWGCRWGRRLGLGWRGAGVARRALPALQGEGGVIGPGLRIGGGPRRSRLAGGRRGLERSSGQGAAPGDGLQAAAGRSGFRGLGARRQAITGARRWGRRSEGIAPGIGRGLPTPNTAQSGRSGRLLIGQGRAPPLAANRRLLPGLPPVVIAVVVEQPIEPFLHPAAQPSGVDAAAPQAPMAQAGPLRAGHAGAGPGPRHPIHQLATPAHPAIEAQLQRFGTATPGATALAGRPSEAIPGGTASGRRFPERSGTARQPRRGWIGVLVGTALRRPLPTIPGLIHGARLTAAARQPALPAEAHQGNGEPTPLQGPEKGGHGPQATGASVFHPRFQHRKIQAMAKLFLSNPVPWPGLSGTARGWSFRRRSLLIGSGAARAGSPPSQQRSGCRPGHRGPPEAPHPERC